MFEKVSQFLQNNENYLEEITVGHNESIISMILKIKKHSDIFKNSGWKSPRTIRNWNDNLKAVFAQEKYLVNNSSVIILIDIEATHL